MSEIRHQPVAPTETRLLTAGEQVDLHHHDEHQLIYASAGVLEVIVNVGTWFTPATRAVWIPAGTHHTWVVHGAAVVHLVGIPISKDHHRHQSLTGQPSLVLVSPLLRELVIAHSADHTDTPASRRLLGVLIDQVHIAPEPATMLPALQDQRLRDVQTILEDNMPEPATLKELGHAVGASERTLSRLFQDETGMGFTVWRNQLRLHRASLRLAKGDTVTDVAADCGWSSASAFITSFRNAFGRTPGSLRHSVDLTDVGGPRGSTLE